MTEEEFSRLAVLLAIIVAGSLWSASSAKRRRDAGSREMSSTDPPTAPTYLRLAGGLTVMLGVSIFVLLLYVGHPGTARAAGAALVVGGIGLVLGQRWAWPFVILAAILMFYLGVLFFGAHSPADPAHRVSYAAYGVPFVIAGCLLVVASTTRATRNWLMRMSP